MPLPGSPALDQGNSAGVNADQRGWARPFDVAGIPAISGSDNSDIGAVEAHPAIVTNDSNDGAGSLREAVANAFPDTDVWFDPVFFATSRIIFLTSEILVGTRVTIQGPDAQVILSGSALGRVFNIASEAPVAMSDLEIIDGKSAANGGAIASNSDLAVTRCTIGNSETDAEGGGVFLQGGVGIFTDSLIGFNHAGGRGGGLGLNGASAMLTNCTVSGNSVPHYGGGISLFTSSGDQTLAVTNATIADNSGDDGAGIRVEALPNLSATATLRNSLLAINTGPSLSTIATTGAAATITSLGYNLSDDDAAGRLVDETDRINTDPQLGNLQDNGGRTFTHALLPGSAAIDRGESSGSSTDQRGGARPLDDPAVPNALGGDGADIGAFEAVPPPPPTATATGTATRTRTATATVSATRTRTATATGTQLPGSTPTATAASATPTRTGTQPTATTTRTGSPAVGTPTASPTATAASATPTRTGTQPTATTTPTGSPAVGTPTTSPTPTATVVQGVCAGDCNGDGQVTIDELVLAVNIAVGTRPGSECPAADRNADGSVTIDELIAAVRNALGTCPR